MRRLRSHTYQEYISWALILVSALMLLSGILSGSHHNSSAERAAARVERTLNRRMTILQSYMQTALEQDNSEWLSIDDLPEDMVVYKYVDDTLRSWNHQFTLFNDDIVDRMRVQVLASMHAGIMAPLADVGSEPSFVQMGSKWYMVCSLGEGHSRIIGGLIVLDDINGVASNGVNKKLALEGNFKIQTLDSTNGVPVYLNGRPMFKVYCDVTVDSVQTNMALFWIALICLLTALILNLKVHNTLRSYALTCLAVLFSIASLYIAGKYITSDQKIFSPLLYADGPYFYSIGALMLVNLLVVALFICTYSARRPILKAVVSGGRAALIAFFAVNLIVVLAIPAAAYAEIRSVIINSGITMELYKINELTWYTPLVYISIVSLLLLIPLILQLLRPLVRKFIGWRYDMLSKWSMAICSSFTAIFVVLFSAIIGFDIEESHQTLWANRLSMTRNVMMEVQLRSAESAIASDMVIAALTNIDNSGPMILNRITENYISIGIQSYNVQVYVMRDRDKTPEGVAFFQNKILSGKPIADNSNFLYSTALNGNTVYTCLFVYYLPNVGVSHMMLELTPKSSRQGIGYAGLLGISPSGRTALPARYSYARFVGRDLTAYNGTYAYPTRLGSKLYDILYEPETCHYTNAGYTHFVNHIGDDSIIVITRANNNFFYYILTFLFVSVILFLGMSLVRFLHRSPVLPVMEKNYYRASATTVMISSLVITLVVMAIVSAIFVYRGNDSNRKRLMFDKVNSLQGLLQEECATAQSTTDLDTPEFLSVMQLVADVAKTDVTMFTTTGKMFKSTVPMVYEMMLSSRVNQDAFEDIIYNHARYSIQKETIAGKTYRAMYAPVFNADGHMLAILCSPYIDDNIDFKSQVILHIITIFTVFLILLLIARISIDSIIDKIFKPLVEMSSKMDSADIDSLQYIQYDREDEISALVGSYNRMVHDLTESTQKLAQAERDRAWSAMARQVAHEIKNPLTPMKLQIQRVIRLKQKGDPTWVDKFDECSKIVLDHIDILTDTANEFSTFAKLYSEEPTIIDIDALIKEEIAMFDNRDEVRIVYLGLEGVKVSGPKPQLTRVLVNLITNAIQAVDMRREEQAQQGQEPTLGRISVSLRNSSARADCYDIVVEDNGSGVSEANQSKLFTPNFTTKSSGTGLGLAICHSILEKCDAQISYSHSFMLGGACFTVTYPKIK